MTTDNTSADMVAPKLATHHEMPWLKTFEKFGLEYDIELPPDEMSLLDVFERNFEEHGDEIAYICMGAPLTYRGLDIYSRQVAGYLQNLGLVKGDRVAVMMPNILQYPICMVGILRAGLTLVNVNPLYTSSELEHQLKDADAKVLFIVENFAVTYQNIYKNLVEHVVVASMGDMLGTFKGFFVNFALRHVKKMIPEWHIEGHVAFKDIIKSVSPEYYTRPTDIVGSDLAVLQYTGGTTGVAKGAMLTHKNLLSNLFQALVHVNSMFPEDDVYGKNAIVALPLYHIFCFTVCGLLTMYKGFTGILIPNPRDLDGFVKELDKYRPVFLPAVNTLFNGLANHQGFQQLDHSNLRVALGGGMAVLESTAKNWKAITGVDIAEGYGLSETSPVASMNPLAIGKYTGKIGIPAPATDIKILNDDGQEVALGERGEIAIKGPQVMAGYWKRPEATAEVMTPDGYFKTGDVGIMDEEGFIKIVDRKKDMILVSGFNVYPNEVEEALSSHPKVLECGVIGVPDDKSGEVPKAYVVKKDPSLTEKELIDHAKNVLTGYKRPRYIKFVDELPKTNVGKILRKELRKMEEKG